MGLALVLRIGLFTLLLGTVVVLLLLFILFLRVTLRTLLGVEFLTLGLSLGLVFLTTGLVIVAGLRVGMYACLKGATLQ